MPVVSLSVDAPLAWQEQGRALVDTCVTRLWSPEGARALAWLRETRGLKEETIQAFRLGFNPIDTWDKRSAWNLKDEPGGKEVWLPRGITIPNQVGNMLWAINIRRPSGKPKYYKISGSQAALFNADWLLGADLVLLVEGEFDCMIAHQELNDVAGVATLGGASSRLDIPTWGNYLQLPKVILAIYDPDRAGKEGVTELEKLSKRIHGVITPILNPGDKDINDHFLAGGDLWHWLKYTLERLDLLRVLGLASSGY